MDNWKAIPGFEGRYEACDDGRIRSLNFNKRTGNVRVLKASLTRGGYRSVTLWTESGNVKQVRLARLIASTFHGVPKDGETVNHINGNVEDDRSCNLEWLSMADNLRHSRQVLGRGRVDKPVTVTCPDGRTLDFISQAEAARALSLDYAAVHRAANGQYASTKGYRFAHKGESK